MKIVILDAKTLGDDIEFSMFNKLGDVSVYQTRLFNRFRCTDYRFYGIVIGKSFE